MRLTRCLPLFLLSLPAAAETRNEAFLGAIDQVVVAGEAEAPLLAAHGKGVQPVVAVTVNGDAEQPPALFVLSSHSSVNTVSADFVARFGLEKKKSLFKGRTGKVEYVVIDSLTVGGMELKGVTAVVNAGSLSGIGEVADQQIGLALLTDTAWSLSSSEGVARFVPADAANALLAKVGGQQVEYATSPSKKIKLGKDKTRLPHIDLIVPAKAGGLELPASIATARDSTRVQEETDRASLTAAIGGPSHGHGDRVFSFAPVSVGGVEGPASWVVSTTATDFTEVDEGLDAPSYIGADALVGFDIAVDPTSRTVAVAAAEAPTRTDAHPGLLEAAVALAEKADAKAAEAAKESGEPAKPAAKEWTDVAELRGHMGDVAGAIEAWGKVLEADDQACAAHHGLGRAQVLAGDLDAAAASLETAGALYHAWWTDDIVVPGSVEAEGHPPSVPMKLRAKYAQVPTKNRKGQWIPALARTYWEAQKADGDDLPEGIVPQPASCWTADSDLAGVALAQGDGAKAVALYEAWMERYPPLRMVLDPKLAQVSANARMAEGDLQAAVAPLRMAAQFDHHKTDIRWALGLALTYADQGKMDSAAPLFLQALEHAQADTVTMALYLDAVAAADGAEAAWDAAKAWAEGRPDYPNAAYGLAYAAQLTGKPGLTDRATRMSAEILDRRALRAPFSPGLLAARARTLTALGDTAGAAEAAKEALALHPAHPAALLADAEVQGAAGKGPKSRGQVKRAAQIAAGHPGYQLLKADFAVKAPAPKPAPEGEGEGEGDTPKKGDAPKGE